MTQGFLPQLDEFNFTTVEIQILENGVVFASRAKKSSIGIFKKNRNCCKPYQPSKDDGRLTISGNRPDLGIIEMNSIGVVDETRNNVPVIFRLWGSVWANRSRFCLRIGSSAN